MLHFFSNIGTNVALYLSTGTTALLDQGERYSPCGANLCNKAWYTIQSNKFRKIKGLTAFKILPPKQEVNAKNCWTTKTENAPRQNYYKLNERVLQNSRLPLRIRLNTYRWKKNCFLHDATHFQNSDHRLYLSTN